MSGGGQGAGGVNHHGQSVCHPDGGCILMTTLMVPLNLHDKTYSQPLYL